MSQRVLPHWLASTAERAEDLKHSLNAFDDTPLRGTGEFSRALAQFQQLSQQVQLLEDRRADGSDLLERHYVVPSGVTGLDVAAVPHLLSTQLEMEMLQQNQQAASSTNLPDANAATISAHNARLAAAHAHLARAALALKLPGAAELTDDKDTKKRQRQQPPPPAAAVASGAAPSPSAVDPEAANTLLEALRTGEGLQPASQQQAPQYM